MRRKTSCRSNILNNFLSQYTKILAAAFTVTLSPSAFSNNADAYLEALDAWSRVLVEHVDEQGRIDFKGAAAEPTDLKRYVDVVAAYGPASHPEDFESRENVLAYHTNTYNALAMWGVVERGIPDGFTTFLKRASFFRFRTVMIAGRKTSLYDYENKVIRPLDEPRMHFVLNCMVRDCPRLPRQVFAGEELNQQLQQATVEFFTEPRKLEIVPQEKLIRVSSILDFYTEDFVESGKARDLPTYINQFLATPLPEGYQVKFVEYDWRINAQP
ncbi:MAG: hypothetical protein ACJAYC_002466 [Halieaceae bacterium]|jgi:hypothetical protein